MGLSKAEQSNKVQYRQQKELKETLALPNALASLAALFSHQWLTLP